MHFSKLSAQLYTVREAAVADLVATLCALARIGFTHVEPFAFMRWGDQLAPALAESGLTAPTAHQRFLSASENEQEEIFAAAARTRVSRIIDPFHPPEHWESTDGVERTAAALNAAATRAAKHGVAVGYHNHAFELSNKPEGTHGNTALEYLAERLDPAVALEIDTYWTAVGGADPVGLLEQLGPRVVAVHLKDGPGTKDTKDQVALGAGRQPIEQIIAAAPHALRVVELDDSRGDRMRALEESFAFLSTKVSA